jgi:hypothetical protein
MTEDRFLDEIRDLQAAALMVLESETLKPSGKGVALQRLFDRARGHAVSELAVPAVQRTVERYFDELFEEPDTLSDPVERRLLQMHARGETTCPRCLLPIPAVSTIRRWKNEQVLGALWRDWLHARVERGAA